MKSRTARWKSQLLVMKRKIDQSFAGRRVGLARARVEFRFVWEEVTGLSEQRAAAAGILPLLYHSDRDLLSDSLLIILLFNG